MAKQGKGSGGTPPPSFGPIRGPKGPKNFLGGRLLPRLLSKGLDDRPTPLFSRSGPSTGHTGLLVFLVENNDGKRISDARYNQ